MYQRKPHILKTNVGAEYPQRLLFVDTETEQIKISKTVAEHKLKLGTYIYVNQSHKPIKARHKRGVFDTTNGFWSMVNRLLTDGHKLFVFAHNMDFDFRVLKGFTWLKDNKYVIDKCIIDSNNFMLKAHKQRRYIEFLDTFNYFKTSLKNIGDFIGLHKFEIDFEQCSKDYLENYCMRDTEIITKVMLEYIEFLKHNDMGCFGRTIAQQSMNTYRHRFMKHPIYIHTNTKAISIERESYYGGRTECFRLGDIKGNSFYYLDINSLYPFMMLQNVFPNRLIRIIYDVDIPKLIEIMNEHLVIADISVTTGVNCLPHRLNRRLCFPIGSWRGKYCTPEIELIIKHGNINQIYSVSIYEQQPLFREFIRFMYNERKYYRNHNNIMYEVFIKRLMNSLYGKWAQHHDIWEKLETPSEWENGIYKVYYPNDIEPVKYKVLNNEIWESNGMGESFNSFVAISSFIASYSRAYLFHLMWVAGDGNVFYCDTDSLFVNQEGYERLHPFIDDREIGMLKLVMQGKRLILYGCKDYVMDDIRCVKGIKKNAIQTGKNTYEQTQFKRFKSMLRDNSLERVVSHVVTKKLRRNYTKGKVKSSGIVSPYDIDL